ncbi:predicted protein [Sclerotinia sclerotiorum 1980 UF-70]|uniref:Uncharacterized protein n=1 Tax=Sclerotinia sclerotiorum (strain ATCC 18683 / 1980 / Ss-1) TaxID=665079 RepID=A7EJ14_SCLS1|nr:predicted protein [Sclerotinia sclerotiorum 1980 UF-70]EDO02830.1 predicted protein [Sclerotinia sclerotiorum 1980 UF-70]
MPVRCIHLTNNPEISRFRKDEKGHCRVVLFDWSLPPKTRRSKVDQSNLTQFQELE